MGRRTLLLIASILVAAVGTGVVALYANSAQDRALQDAAPVDVLYVKAPIQPGTSLSDALKSTDPRQVSANAAPPQGQRLTAQTVLPPEQVTTRVINPGELLSLAMFPKPDAQGSTNPLGLKDGHVAVSITVTDVARVAGFAGPGSWVALFVTRPQSNQTDNNNNNNGDQAGQQTNLLFKKPVRVLKTFRADLTAATPEQTLVTLDLTPDQATRVILASETESNIYMALVTGENANLESASPLIENSLRNAG